MVGWHHQLHGHESEQTLGGGEGQENLVCCSPRGHKESDTTQRLNNNKSSASHFPIVTVSSYAFPLDGPNRHHPAP